MKALSSLKSELLGIIHNRKLLIAIIGVMTIPLLYSGTFLWAFWNPYGHVDRLPVAVVNYDQGAVYNGEKLEIGEDLVEKLKDKKSFNWKFVSEKQANRGLEKQDYYIKIEIPKDFSKNATTLQSNHPKKLTLIYTPNEGTNYLSSKIGDSAIEKIKEEVAGAVTETYAESMFDQIKDVAKGLNKASDGAKELHNGIDSAKEGAGKLNSGIGTAKTGAAKLTNGASSVNNGANKIEQNLQTLAEKSITFSQGLQSASSGSKDLESGLQQFDTGLTQMQDGNAKLLDGAQKSQAGAKKLTDGLDSAASKMPDLQKGSQQLADGATGLSSSMEKWRAGAADAKTGSAQVSEGLQVTIEFVTQMEKETNDPVEKAKLEGLKGNLEKLSEGSQKVTGGVGALSDNAALLEQGSDQLAAGASQLNNGQNQLADGVNQLSSGAKQLEDGQSQLVQGLGTFGDKLNEAKKGFSQITDGSSNLSSGLNELAAGSTKLQDGTNKLADGSKQLSEGTGQLYDGTKSLTGGMSKLGNGSADLTSGMEKLADGSKELQDKLKDGAQDASDVKANNSVYNMFAKPVKLKEDRMNHVPDYGTGFTPYFLSLSLFVGALMLSIIFPMYEPARKPKSGFSWFAGKLGILLIVGVGQALLADVVLLTGLGLEVKSVPLFIMLSIFTSWTFLAIIQFLVTVLDNPGRFLAVIILILQLTSSAGTYPIELVPRILQKMTRLLPMTYSIAGFRSIISTGDISFMWENIGYISVFFIAFLAGTLAFFVAKFKRQNVQHQEG
ncbi:YhgE/Pip domain-containing protein [Neobacillus niacini]|uniref:YhgE/Pip domain-containing protein n=1 Tax=Neobacillus niacini TaxID=86668 RepID=UPI00285C081A|nr:YhgE/Pip domain-containing protein [Neobacillus niacini]MDR7002014.1 putative membrane protein [Neobacillus niacini]